MQILLRWTTLTLAFALAPLPSARAAIIGQADTFQTGTLENWFAGGGPFGAVPAAPPSVLTGGGPGGVGDAFMLVSAVGGSGAGSRLVVQNDTQWAGNYLAAGLSGISMDLRNFGTSELTIRLELISASDHRLVTSAAAVLLAGGGWTSVSFDLAPTGLTALVGDASAGLADVTRLRIIHATTAALSGFSVAEPVAGQLGVDNITALGAGGGGGGIAVPEPSSLVLLASSLFGLCAIRRRPRG